MTTRAARLHRRRERARKIVDWWLSPDGEAGYEALIHKIVEAQAAVELHILPSCCQPDDIGTISCKFAEEFRQAKAEREVALNYARDLRDSLEALVNRLRLGFVRDDVAVEFTRATRLLEETRQTKENLWG